MIQLQEHDRLNRDGFLEHCKEFDNLELIQWDRPLDNSPWGYYASFKIGAEWIDEKEALVVTTKRRMENIDFIGMFMTCFSSNLSSYSFSRIYRIDFDKPAIHAPSLQCVVSPLIISHFLCVISRIKELRKGYIHHSENIKKVKGHVNILKNERLNIVSKRYDRVFCDYDEYSVDIPENRLLKKALLFSKGFVNGLSDQESSHCKIKVLLSKALALFDGVSDDVDAKQICQIRAHKLFSDYNEALRLAKLILRHFDYAINKTGIAENKIVPFVIDMSLLYEHYVYGLLNEAYPGRIAYQFKGVTGFPDFLYKTTDYKAILDTKYIPKYEDKSLDTYVVRQLSGYSRDIPILKKLGYSDIATESPIPNVPCIIIYPDEGKTIFNPFLKKRLSSLCTAVPRLSQFYKISVPLPTLDAETSLSAQKTKTETN